MTEVHASPVVVTVTPHKPSYFAGEHFVCDITFTNTNVFAAPSGRRIVSDSAKPDSTSTDSERVSDPVSFPQRLGLLSESERASPSSIGRPSHLHRRFPSRSEQWSPGLMLTPPPRKRAPLVVAPTHPHARQKSIAHQPSEDLTRAFGLSQQRTVPEQRAAPSPNPDDFFSEGQSSTMDNTLRDSFNTWSQSQRHASANSPWSSGSKPTESPVFPQPESLSPGHEKILWSFAQLGGTLEIDRSLIDPNDFDRAKVRLAMGELPSTPNTGTPRTIGGGDFGYDTEIEGGTLAMEHGTPIVDTEPRTFGEMAAMLMWHPLAQVYNTHPGGSSIHMRTNHIPRNQRSGSTLADIRERALFSRTLPTFSTPPSMLDVDVTLAPGESRTYTFSIDLPADLPPSFHGRSVRFDYYMSIGTNRLSGTSQQSRLLHVPIRVYNHIAPRAGVVSVFDLFNPIVLPHAVAEIVHGSHAKPKGRAEQALHDLVQQLALGNVAPPVNDGEPEDISCMAAINDMARTAGKGARMLTSVL